MVNCSTFEREILCLDYQLAAIPDEPFGGQLDVRRSVIDDYGNVGAK